MLYSHRVHVRLVYKRWVLKCVKLKFHYLTLKFITMLDLDDIEKVLTGETSYYIVEKRDSYHGKESSEIVLIGLRPPIQIGLKLEDITFKDMKVLTETYIDTNYYLYPVQFPFQSGFKLKYCNQLFPVTCNVTEFLKEALGVFSSDIYEYLKIIKKLTKPETKFEENE